MRSIYLLPLVLLACGDGKKDPLPDARVAADAAIDAPPMLTCEHTEAADATNDEAFGTGTPEAAGFTFTNAKRTICGKLDNTHYVANDMLVDSDSYMFTVPAQSSAVVSLTAPGAEALNGVFIEIYGMTTSTSETGKFIGTFAIASADLAPGDYVVTVTSLHGSAPAAAIDYRLTIANDNPLVRCPKSTAAGYPEANDTTLASGNDVYEVRYGGAQPARKLTDFVDNPEPTGIVAAPGMSYHVTGTNVVPNATPLSWSDSFMDRDTYAIAMDATANQLSVRVNWPGSTADFDLFVFPVDGLGQPTVIEIAQGYYMSTTEDEFVTLAVTPGATYWVFVGAVDGSTGHPVNYEVTFCAAAFTP